MKGLGPFVRLGEKSVSMALASSSTCRLAVRLPTGAFVGVPLRVAELQSELEPRVTAGAWALKDVGVEVF